MCQKMSLLEIPVLTMPVVMSSMIRVATGAMGIDVVFSTRMPSAALFHSLFPK